MTSKILKHTLAAMVISTAGYTTAFAETGEKLTGKQLEGYLKGSTVYVDILPGDGAFGDGGLSPFYYGHDGKFVADLPAKKISGTWELSEKSSYCINIVGVNRTFCTDVIRKSSSIEHHSVGLKRLMGTVVRVVPGNDANL